MCERGLQKSRFLRSGTWRRAGTSPRCCGAFGDGRAVQHDHGDGCVVARGRCTHTPIDGGAASVELTSSLEGSVVRATATAVWGPRREGARAGATIDHGVAMIGPMGDRGPETAGRAPEVAARAPGRSPRRCHVPPLRRRLTGGSHGRRRCNRTVGRCGRVAEAGRVCGRREWAEICWWRWRRQEEAASCRGWLATVEVRGGPNGG
jgi:hypothetical protein